MGSEYDEEWHYALGKGFDFYWITVLESREKPDINESNYVNNFNE